MPPKEYDLKGITLGFNGRATTLVANEIVNGGFWLDLGVRGLPIFIRADQSQLKKQPLTPEWPALIAAAQAFHPSIRLHTYPPPYPTAPR
jgi:hypothetical protein